MGIMQTLFEITVYSAVIFTAIMLLKKVLGNRMSPRLHYAVWVLLIVRLMLPVTIDSGLKLFTIPLPAQSQPQKQSSAGVEISENMEQINSVAASNTQGFISSPPADADADSLKPAMQAASNKAAPVWNAGNILAAVWLAGMGASLIYLAFSYAFLRTRIKRAAAPAKGRLLKLFEQCNREMDIRGDIRVLSMEGIGTPALFIPSTVLIPAKMLLAADDEQITYALRHELTHYRRKDHIVSTLLVLLQVVYWFNPFVWLAFKQIRLDVEVACDSSVVKSMGSAERCRYASMIVSLSAVTKHRQFALGMARGNTKKAAEKRVRGIFTPNKSRGSAMLVTAVLAILLFVTCFTTACQPTPEAPVVVNKAEGVMEQVVKQTEMPEEEYNVPTVWKDTLQKEGSKLIIDVDAAVTVPDVGAYPIMKISPGRFTQEQADRMVQVLFKGKTVYGSSRPLTKSELEDRLVELKADLEGKKKDPKYVDNSIEDLENEIKLLEDQIRSAPETVSDEVGSTLLQENEYGEIRLDLKADLGKKENATLWLMNQGNGVIGSMQCFAQFINTDSGGPFQRFDEWHISGDKPTALKISREEAVAQAEQMLSDLGVTDMDIAAISPGIIGGSEGDDVSANPQCYIICFTRTVGGVPTTLTRTTGTGITANPEEIKNGDYPPDFRPPWDYERITVCVDDSGIAEFDWDSPVNMLESITDDAALIPFEQLQKSFEQQIFNKYAYIEDYEGLLSQTYHVKDIKLGLTRVASKDNLDEYILIPVWNFFGSIQDSYDIDVIMEQFSGQDAETLEEVRKYYEEMNNSEISQSYDSFITLSAIDGSVIDLNLGY